jgi:hypothetical protein
VKVLSYGRTALSSALLPETLALRARFVTPPSGGRLRLIDRTIQQLKAGGVWDELDALWVFAAADAQAGQQNWKSASFAATEVSAPTFTADRGYNGNATSSYVNLNYNPAVNATHFAQDDACGFAWSLTEAQSNQSCFGWYDGTDGMTVQPRNTSNFFSTRANQAAATTIANSDGRGLFSYNRTGATAMQLFQNGASVGSATTASAAVNSVNLNVGHSTAAGFSNVQVAACGIGGALSPSQHGVLYTALSRYMQQVGAV